MRHRIVLVHAVRVAMDPIATAFRQGWPEAETVNLLDDGLSRDLERRGTLEGPMTERIGALAAYASGLGADGILYTCSAFGSAIEKGARSQPHSGAETQRGDARGRARCRPPDRARRDLRADDSVDDRRVAGAGT